MPMNSLLGSQFAFMTFQEGQAGKLHKDVQLLSQQLLAVLSSWQGKDFSH